MNENIMVSVVVPVYNTADYLPKCIESIQNQTHKNIEIILVDDGSTDGSGKICDAYAAKDERIKVSHMKNKGITAARKAGVNMATGSYVGFVDSDDWIDATMYEELLDKAVSFGCQMVLSDIMRHTFSGETIIWKGAFLDDGVYDMKNKHTRGGGISVNSPRFGQRWQRNKRQCCH